MRTLSGMLSRPVFLLFTDSGMLLGVLAVIFLWFSLPSKIEEGVSFLTVWKSSEFISDNEFIDLPLQGWKYTRTNNQSRVAMSKIDCFLISKEWGDHFSGVIQVALPRVLFGHIGLNVSPIPLRWTGGQVHLDLKIVGCCIMSSCLWLGSGDCWDQIRFCRAQNCQEVSMSRGQDQGLEQGCV